MKGAINT